MTMNIKLLQLITILAAIMFLSQCKNDQAETISFYAVPLKCGAAPDIGCGSRIKPLFLDTEKEKEIKESWSNRQGTVIAIVWNGKENEKLIQSLFRKHDIEAKLITGMSERKTASANFKQEGKWLKGLEIDKLSIEEASVISKDLTQFAEDEKLITHDESENIRKDLREYFEKELVIVRSSDELKSADTQDRWRSDGFAIYEKHIGKERANKVSELYTKYESECENGKEESCCDKEKRDECCDKKPASSADGENKSTISEITCPTCGFKKVESLPTDKCVLKYTCTKCQTILSNKKGDCCVFCSYGNHKCPSKQ